MPADQRIRTLATQLRKMRYVKQQEWLVEAQRCYELNNLSASVVILKQLLSDDPDCQRARSLFHQIELLQATQDANAQKEERIANLTKEGLEFMAQAQYRFAIARFREILVIDPTRVQVQQWLSESQTHEIEAPQKSNE
jgi:tetratricopeptide (TPR) repeat protein